MADLLNSSSPAPVPSFTPLRRNIHIEEGTPPSSPPWPDTTPSRRLFSDDLSDDGVLVNNGDATTGLVELDSDRDTSELLFKQEPIDWKPILPELISDKPTVMFKGPHTAIQIPYGPNWGMWLHIPRKLSS